jgi:MFS family permease
VPDRTRIRLGPDFAKLWAASAISTVGDGITLTAGPLLVASLTSSPLLVASAAFAQQLPLLALPLIGGVYADRLDRRRLLVTVAVLRGLAVAGLALAVATGAAGIPLVCVVFLLLGAGEIMADTASAALLPGIVPAGHLTTANARLMAVFSAGNQILAKPLGGYLFGVAAALPFGADALTFLPAALRLAAIRPVRPGPAASGEPGPQPAEQPGEQPAEQPAGQPASRPAPGPGLRAEIGEGIRWLWGHRLLRALAFAMGAGNVVFGAAFAVFVLYARERLGVTGTGYGTLLMASATGGLAGTSVVSRLRARLGTARLLRAGLVIETLTHVSLALATSPWSAGAILVVFGAHAMVWGAVVTSTLQRSVPDRLRGRVTGAYLLLQNGGAALGTLLGGACAAALGITAPFWIAAAVMAVVTALAWRPLRQAAA